MMTNMYACGVHAYANYSRDSSLCFILYSHLCDRI